MFRDSRDHRPKSPGISARSPIRSSTPNDEIAAKKMKMESDLRKSGHESDSGDKSDGDLVVDVGGDEEGARRPLENGDHRDLGDRRPDRDRPPSKQFPEIQALGDAAFDFQFEDSDLLATMVGEDTYEKCPEKYTQHCWLVSILVCR